MAKFRVGMKVKFVPNNRWGRAAGSEVWIVGIDGIRIRTMSEKPSAEDLVKWNTPGEFAPGFTVRARDIEVV